MRLDHIRIGGSIADLTDNYLHAPINLDETGNYVTSSAWTGTLADGTHASATCSNWSPSGSTGWAGDVDAASASWTDLGGVFGCSSALRLYCLQDLPLVFADGFESGNTNTWSSTTP